MNRISIDIQKKAYDSISQLLELAGESEKYFIDAGLALPEPLALLLGKDSSIDDSTNNAGTFDHTGRTWKSPEPPEGALDTWISIPMGGLQTSTLVCAILRHLGRIMPPREIIREMQRYQPGIADGGVYNVGARKEDRIIDKTVEGWKLIDPSKAPVIHNDYAWGPAELFGTHEKAAHRRLLILKLLQETAPEGLTRMQIVEKLEKTEECKAPSSKDLVGLDLNMLLEADKIRRIGTSREWKIN